MSASVSRLAYKTPLGAAYESSIESFLSGRVGAQYKGLGTLLLTSPPYPLKKKKKYGNLQGEEYLEWVGTTFAEASSLLGTNGSMVVEIGNSWDPGRPTMSTLPLRSLMNIAEQSGFYVCQQFICNNTARLPGPAQWVTVERRRVKDSYTHVWWFARDPYIKADNKRVVEPYSASMKRLLKTGKYNSGTRPSGWHMNETSFLEDHGGAIPSNVLQISNTNNDTEYRNWCKTLEIPQHPARMPRSMAEFFINFLTDPGDLVIDIFGGSNTTGSAAESSGRRWLTIEKDRDYLRSSMGRFKEISQQIQVHNEPYVETKRSLRSFLR